MKKHFYLLCLMFLSTTALFAQSRIYVNLNASGQNNGQSWANAFTNLHDGLTQSEAGDTIWVVKGSYFPTTGLNRDIPFVLKSGVVLLGGFKGTETQSIERDWENNPSILDGDIGIKGDSTDNAYTLLTCAYADEGTLIDGFIFQNGNASDGTGALNGRQQNGGAIYILAPDFEDAYLKVKNCRFLHNTAKNYAGAVFITGFSMASVAPVFENCIFDGNMSENAGVFFSGQGTYDEDKFARFEYCTFLNNQATNLGANIFLRLQYGTGNYHFKDCFFENNKSFIVGFGQLLIQYEYIDAYNFFFENLNFNLQNQYELVLNISAFSNIPGVVLLDSVKFSQTTTQPINSVGINFFAPESNMIINNILSDKLSIDNLRMSFKTDNSPLSVNNIDVKIDTGRFSCDLKNNTGRVELKNSNFSNNEKLHFNFLGSINETTEIDLHDNIFSNNMSGSTKTRAAMRFHAYNNLFLNNKGNLLDTLLDVVEIDLKNNVIINSMSPNLGTSTGQDFTLDNNYFDALDTTKLATYALFGANNIIGSQEPLFINPDTNNYHLHPCSPLINAGTNIPIIDLAIDTDLDGNPRILDGTVDIGPYESNHVLGQLSPPDITAACYGLAEGKVTFAAEGGCPPYALAWTRSDDGSMGSDTTGLLAGTYLFTLTDARGRQLEVPLQIGGSTPQVAIVGDSLACAFTPNAFLQANATNATQPIDFQWNIGNNTGSINNLGAGLYSVEITDGFGCKDSASVEVIATPPVNASIQIINATGANKSDGALNFVVSSGYPPYSYAWSNGATADSISNLLPGDYTVTVIDGNNCGYVFTYTVSFMVDTEIPTLPDATNTIWPNPLPAGAPLNVRFSTADLWHLMDAQGRVLFSVERTFSPFSSLQTMQIELPCLASGTYFWSFSRAGRSVSAGKLVL